VKVCELNLALHDVHKHNKVCAVCTHIIMVCMVCIVLAECRGVWLVCAQYGNMLLCDSLVNGVRKVLVRSGGVLNFGMMQRVD
jgi:hypothetical protein